MSDSSRKHTWIKAATDNAHGQFRAKAERAGETTRQYAEEHKGDRGMTGRQARLAITLMGMRHGSPADRRYKRMT